jgi:hypothetical protein
MTIMKIEEQISLNMLVHDVYAELKCKAKKNYCFWKEQGDSIS